MELRNVAIIAHVDHGKTTLMDKVLYQSKIFREGQDVDELVLDSNDLERERGITILSKNVSVRYKDVKINFIDTPGHSDFGGEVERVLNMADGVLLLVDAAEGPMPQTRFVLQKALELGLEPIVVINKVDRPDRDPDRVSEELFELMFTLDASEEQLDYVTVYGSSKEGWMGSSWKEPTEDVSHLLDTIIEHVDPPQEREGTLQMRVSSLDYSSYTGRIAIGRIHRGSIREGQKVSVVHRDGQVHTSTVKELHLFEGLGKERAQGEVKSGELVAIVGLESFDIGDTIADPEEPEGLTPIKVDEPSMSMLFTVNDSPFYGKEGTYVTSRHIKDRLYKETEKNLALQVEESGGGDDMMVYGRGVLHLSILVETMRREGYELQLGQPRVLIKEVEGTKHEPIEVLHVNNVSEESSGKVIEMANQRKGELLNMEKKEDGRVDLEFRIPARGLIGLTNPVLTMTGGEAMIFHRFDGYEPWKGDMQQERKGSLIAMETGTAKAFALNKLQDRGRFFVDPNEEVYAGQVVGESTRHEDLTLNVAKGKKLTNMRSSGADEKISIAPATKFSLEEAMEHIAADEYVEVTPQSLRMRKIQLSESARKRAQKAEKEEG
jgi:GTP-binding protein